MFGQASPISQWQFRLIGQAYSLSSVFQMLENPERGLSFCRSTHHYNTKIM
jgi:hypothetical protein